MEPIKVGIGFGGTLVFISLDVDVKHLLKSNGIVCMLHVE